MECPPTMTPGELFDVTIKVCYNGEVAGPEGAISHTTTRAITFRSWSIIGLDTPGGPPTMTPGELFDVTIKACYNGEVAGPEGAINHTTTRAITFRSWSSIGLDTPDGGFKLLRRPHGGDGDTPWESCDSSEGGMGCGLFDDPDRAVKVVAHEHFTTLRLGESWTRVARLQGPWHTRLPEDIVPGDVFRYAFDGVVVDWWDWGNAEDHAETVVMLRCWECAAVTDPADNGGRPKLVVPQSEPVEFKVEGS